MKMKSSALIHGAMKAWIGTRMMRETSRRTMVPSPIQLMPMGVRLMSSTVVMPLPATPPSPVMPPLLP